jgi:hypothetical protein
VPSAEFDPSVDAVVCPNLAVGTVFSLAVAARDVADGDVSGWVVSRPFHSAICTAGRVPVSELFAIEGGAVVRPRFWPFHSAIGTGLQLSIAGWVGADGVVPGCTRIGSCPNFVYELCFVMLWIGGEYESFPSSVNLCVELLFELLFELLDEFASIHDFRQVWHSSFLSRFGFLEPAHLALVHFGSPVEVSIFGWAPVRPDLVKGGVEWGSCDVEFFSQSLHLCVVLNDCVSGHTSRSEADESIGEANVDGDSFWDLLDGLEEGDLLRCEISFSKIFGEVHSSSLSVSARVLRISSS